jgi:hypothetical protein
MGKIHQSLVYGLDQDASFLQSPHDLHQQVHLRGKASIAVGSHAPKILVACQIPSHGVKPVFEFHQLTYEGVDRCKLLAGFFKGEVPLMNVF